MVGKERPDWYPRTNARFKYHPLNNGPQRHCKNLFKEEEQACDRTNPKQKRRSSQAQPNRKKEE